MGPQKQQPPKHKQKKFGKKKGKIDVVQNKLSHLDQLFAGSSAEEDSEEEEEEKETQQQKLSKKRSSKEERKDEPHSKRPRNDYGKVTVQQDDSDKNDDSGEEESPNSDVDNNDDASVLDDDNDDDDLGDDDNDSLTHERSIQTMVAATANSSKAQNMARAMARILGTPATDDKKVIVLSKTITKIQKIQSETRMENTSLSRKRNERKHTNLACMYIPPPITTNTNSNNKQTTNATKAAQQVQNDRVYRRIATRGVVALFNAISQHQQQQQQLAAANSKTSEIDSKTNSTTTTTVTSKREFLEKIKESVSIKEPQQTATKIGAKTLSSATTTTSITKKGVGWNALTDDYMMSSNKLKDWDKDDFSASTSGEEENNDDTNRSNLLLDDDDLSD